MDNNIDEILENVKIEYNDGKKDFFEAIHLTNQGIFFGRIINNEFVNSGFIPKKNIKFINENKTKKIKI